MTSLNDLFNQIESHRFSALTNVASDLRTFLRAVRAQPEVQHLTIALQSPDVQAQVGDRVRDLLAAKVNSDFEHPQDAALAAYLWLLNDFNKGLARTAAGRVAECPPCWWAKKIAHQVLAESDSRCDAGNGPPSGSTPNEQTLRR